MEWVLIIWLWGNSNSVPSIPVRVDSYSSEGTCSAAGNVWRDAKHGQYQSTQRHYICLPGRPTT